MSDERPGSQQPGYSPSRVVLPPPQSGTWPQSTFPSAPPDPTPRQGTAPQVPFPSMSADFVSQQDVLPQDDFSMTVEDPVVSPDSSPQAGFANVFQNPGSQRMKSGLLINPNRVRGSFFNRLGHLLRTDPAYQVLAIAVAGVLIACLIFVVVAGSLFAPPGLPMTAGGTNQKSVTTPTTAPDLTPTTVPTTAPTATPNTTATSAPTVAPTTPVVPTQTPVLPALQITKIPAQVVNGSRVAVTVQANKPGVSVWLSVTFNSSIGGNNTTSPATANGSGVATVSWHVSAIMINSDSITATVYAVINGQNGQQIKSAPVTVTVQPK